jgi:hypothetical protein
MAPNTTHCFSPPERNGESGAAEAEASHLTDPGQPTFDLLWSQTSLSNPCQFCLHRLVKKLSIGVLKRKPYMTK